MRQAAIAWERERDAADALVRQIADAEQLLGLPASPEVGAMSSGSAGPCVAHTTVIWHDPADPLVAQLHYQAGGSRTSGSWSRSSSSQSPCNTPCRRPHRSSSSGILLPWLLL